MRLAHESLEGGQIRLAHVFERDPGVETMALRLGTAVDGVVLRRRSHLQVARIVALDASHEGDAHPRDEIRVLAVGLLAAAPARVAEEVDVRAEHREPAEPLDLAFPGERLRVLRTRLVTDHGRDAQHQLGVERRRQPDGLREDGRLPRHGDTVERLAPVLVLREPEPRDRGRAVHQLRRLLVQRHPGDEVPDTRFEAPVRVPPERALLCEGAARGAQRDGAEHGASEQGSDRSGHGHLAKDRLARPSAEDDAAAPRSRSTVVERLRSCGARVLSTTHRSSTAACDQGLMRS